jgi:hypothetical protein
MNEQTVTDDLKRQILQQIGAKIVREAKRLAPIDLGHLRGNIHYKVIDNKLRVFTEGVPYADYMEYGRPPYMPTEEEKMAIEDWAERHNIPAWVVIRKHKTKGIEAGTPEDPFKVANGTFRPFMRTAFFRVTKDVIRVKLRIT